MSDEVLDDVMIKGSCKGKADAIVNCQCNIETAPSRCDQAEHCMFYSYYKCSKQWKRLAEGAGRGFLLGYFRRGNFCQAMELGRSFLRYENFCIMLR